MKLPTGRWTITLRDNIPSKIWHRMREGGRLRELLDTAMKNIECIAEQTKEKLRKLSEHQPDLDIPEDDVIIRHAAREFFNEELGAELLSVLAESRDQVEDYFASMLICDAMSGRIFKK